MKTQTEITQTLFIQEGMAGNGLRLSCVDMSGCTSFAVLGTVEVTVPVPDDLKDPNVARIESLQRRRNEVLDESSAKVADLDDRIKKLQAIEYDGSEVA